MISKPPCKVGDMDCPKRKVGCRSKCKAWAKWTDEHNREREIISKKRHDEHMADDTLCKQGERVRRDNRRKIEKRYKEGHRK